MFRNPSLPIKVLDILRCMLRKAGTMTETWSWDPWYRWAPLFVTFSVSFVPTASYLQYSRVAGVSQYSQSVLINTKQGRETIGLTFKKPENLYIILYLATIKDWFKSWTFWQPDRPNVKSNSANRDFITCRTSCAPLKANPHRTGRPIWKKSALSVIALKLNHCQKLLHGLMMEHLHVCSWTDAAIETDCDLALDCFRDFV